MANTRAQTERPSWHHENPAQSLPAAAEGLQGLLKISTIKGRMPLAAHSISATKLVCSTSAQMSLLVFVPQ